MDPPVKPLHRNTHEVQSIHSNRITFTFTSATGDVHWRL